ncbi:FAD:protein FMN transferase [Frigoribacterium sp. UYMn621]|uniref:FAD:protein FMN transferase n=1 Tax=Frigoribacterium sp. UYMn621 TaxID=3156343 RepID=UPI003390BF49
MTVRRDWRDWSCDVSVVVSESADVELAEGIVRQVMDDVSRACSRFRADSELSMLASQLPGGAEVSELLARLVRSALDVATLTEGDVDPTLGIALRAVGYDRDLSELPTALPGEQIDPRVIVVTRRTAGWTRVMLEQWRLAVPADLALDLGATAKAIAVDLAAERVATRLGCSVLVNIGGDLKTSGAPVPGGWQVLVQDLPADPAQQVSVGAGAAIATSSTQKRTWAQGGYLRHHILDPRSGLPVEPVWRSVSVAAGDCLLANAYSTASIVRGHAAVAWLEGAGVSARLVDRAGRVITTGSWPVEVSQEQLVGVGDV